MSKKGLGKLVLGAGIGASLALLFAPKKGSDLRNDIKKKINEFMKSVETHKSFTNRGERITKVFWIMDLTNGQRLLSYSNPSSIKTLSNSKLISEEVTLHHKLLVPANVTTLWRLDATYLIEQGKEVYDKAEVRKYG